MRMSEYIRHWQMTGQVPDDPNIPQEMPLYAGYLFGSLTVGMTLKASFDDRREMAIKVAKFIEAQVEGK